MRINKPTYLIAELKGDVVPLVCNMRKRFNPAQIMWPVDITIAGSSGIGTIKEGQDIKEIVACLEPIISKNKFSAINFISISRFTGTGIYHLVPERELFDKLHTAVSASGVLFNENKWPYNPHCSLRSGPEPTKECDVLFETVELPQKAFIDSFSLYQPEPYGGYRAYRF